MTTTALRPVLSPEEWRIVCALRDVPESALREDLTGVLNELVELVREPHCPEYQADGVPCATVDVACEECQQLTEILLGLKNGIQQCRSSRKR